MTVSPRILPASPPASRRAWDPWRHGEPDLMEVMADPIIHLVMRRDGLSAERVWPVVREAQARLGRSLCRSVSRAA